VTFDYTAVQLVAALPDLGLKTRTGRVDGVLPLLLRLDWSSPDVIYDHARQFGTGLLQDLISWRAMQAMQEGNPGPKKARRAWIHPSMPPFGDGKAAERWGRGKPNRDDIEDLLRRLEENDFLGWFQSDRDLLDSFLEDLVKNAATATDVGDDYRLLVRALAVRYVWDDRGRLRLVLTDFVNPNDRARIEAMSAYTEGRPGLIRCDICERLFVPIRAGRPARRCPGFQCQLEAEQRYQQSPERREYRRLSMRLNRARVKGDAAAVGEAERELAELKSRRKP
jgi:hypothetical protein